jgi:hypothetical protein
MRLWLDQSRIEPSAFRYVSRSPLPRVRVDKAESEASAFAEHLGGPTRRVGQGTCLQICDTLVLDTHSKNNSRSEADDFVLLAAEILRAEERYGNR